MRYKQPLYKMIGNSMLPFYDKVYHNLKLVRGKMTYESTENVYCQNNHKHQHYCASDYTNLS